MTRPGPRLWKGILALTKSALLLVAVPAALWRLWLLGPLPKPLLSVNELRQPGWWLHLLLVALGLLWATAGVRLVRELVLAILRPTLGSPTTWSARWAAGIAALLIISGTGTLAATITGRTTVAATHPLERDRPRPSASGSVVVVTAGECLADVASRSLGRPELWSLLFGANLDAQQIDGGRLVDANLLSAGWCLKLPVGQPSAVETTPRLTGSRSRLVELGLLGLGVLTTAALARRLRRLRAVGESERAPGTRFAPSGRRTAFVESMIAPLAAGSLIDWIDCANRLITASCQKQDLPGQLLLVRAAPEGLELLFDHAPAPPPPFRPLREQQWWSLPFDLDLSSCQRLADGARRHCPQLVPIGDDENAVYLLGLGPSRRLSLEGEPVLAEWFLAGLLDALRVLPWAEELEIELLGLSAPPLAERSYQFAESSAAALRRLGGTARAAREDSASWRREPLAIASARCSPDELASLLIANRGCGMVTVGGPGTEVLQLSGGRAVLAPYGIEVTPSAPTEGQQHLFELLLAQASRAPEVIPRAPSVAGGAAPAALAEPGAIEVRLLVKPPQLAGVAALAPQDASRVTELLAYLLLHNRIARMSDVTDALFGRSTLYGSPTRLEMLLAGASRVLGTEQDGTRRLRLTTEDRVELSSEVTADWIRVSDAIAAARSAPATEAVTLLDGAFSMLASSTDSDLEPYDWIVAEGLRDDFVSEIVDGAHHLCALTLSTDRQQLAMDAVMFARRYASASEILARDLMSLQMTNGANRDAVATYRALEQDLAALGGLEPSDTSRTLARHLLPRAAH